MESESKVRPHGNATEREKLALGENPRKTAHVEKYDCSKGS